MKPHQYALTAAQILKDRGNKLGDYNELYENLAARLNLSFKNKLNNEKSVFVPSSTAFAAMSASIIILHT